MGLRPALIAALLACASPGMAADEPELTLRQRIKAAFLYKFAAYVEWPARAFAEPGSPIVIGVAGAERIASELERAVHGRKVSGRPVQVRRLSRGDAPSDCCQILFVGGEREATAELLAQAQGRPVLTVTEVSAEHPQGSIINFLEAQDRIRFDISRAAAQRNGLQLRSPLLSVARQVKAAP